MNENDTIQTVKNRLGDKVLEIANPSPRRIFLKVDRSDLAETVLFLKSEFDYSVVSTISGVDRGEHFEVLYHLTNADAALSVRVLSPRPDPRIPSICGIIPGAILYERELQDMFGLVVEGIPDPRPLLLPDDWPAGAFPLRKDWTFERPPEVIPGGGR